VIRRWLKQTGAPGISAYKLGTFCTQVQQADSDTKVSVHFDGWLLRLYRKQLWLQTDLQMQPCPALNWPDVHNKIDMGNDAGQFELSARNAAGKFPGPPGSFSKIGDFSVCSRLDVKGAVFNQGRGHKSLKNIFQSYGIPPWLRASIPLCRLDGEVVAVGDWCFSTQFTAWLSANGIGLHWHPRHPLLQFIHKQLHRLKH
jgi:tRNA(Ile)-lysidine synthase